MPTVNSKGSIAEAIVLADLTKQGYHVFTPFDDHGPVDLVVANDEYVFKRIQIKYRSAPEKGRVRLSLDSVVNGRRIRVNTNHIDAYALYCPDVDKVYYVTNFDILANNLYVDLQSDLQDASILFG